MMVLLLNGINKVMQLDLFAMFAEAESRPKVQPVTKPVRKVQPCSLAEFRASQEIEHDLFCGRAAWLYKQLEREINQQAEKLKAESQVLASGWR